LHWVLLCILQKINGEVKLGFNGDLYPTAGASTVMTTKGDMVDYNTARQRLGIGSANQILQVKSNLPSWETVDLADTVLTTAGDVLYENATPELARLGAGTQYNNLQMGASLPAWSASSTSVLTTTGDLLYASASNTLARLASVSSGQVLTSQGVGSAPAWAVAGGGGAVEFVEEFVQASSATSMDIPLTTPYNYADFDHLILQYCFKADVSSGGQGLNMQFANWDVAYWDADYHSCIGYNSHTTACVSEYQGGVEALTLYPDDTIFGNGVDNDHPMQGTVECFNATAGTGSYNNKPIRWNCNMVQQPANLFYGSGFHERVPDNTSISALRFAICLNDMSNFDTATFNIDADSWVRVYTVSNS